MSPNSRLLCVTCCMENITAGKLIQTNIGKVGYFNMKSPDKSGDNEDAAAIIQTDEDTLILVIADGVGGLPSGAQASNILIKKIKDACKDYQEQGLELRDAILSGIERANNEIINLNAGSATTLAAVVIQKSFIRTYHVGDSAIMVVGQRGKLILENVLHSPTGYAVESGMMTEDEALLHKDRHIVSNVIGTRDMHISMSVPIKLKKFDTLLLASDGLIDNIDKSTIMEIIRKGNLSDCLNRLLKLTNQRMTSGDPAYKPDDTSCILFRRSH